MHVSNPFRLCLIAILCLSSQLLQAEEPSRPNLLIITVDDMSADSLGVYGCSLPDTSPSIDAFARQSLRYEYAHVQVGNCMPGRNIMWSGMFAHANGVEGFVQNKEASYPVLCDLAKQAGYFAAIRGKTAHSTPYTPYAWDAVLDSDERGRQYRKKDAKGYGASTSRGIQLAKESGKPFCLMVNISDPHKPFYGQKQGSRTVNDPNVPSRVFTAKEVPVPGFLPSDEAIRTELALYYSSVRRADDCFREVMKALDDSGQAENTFVMFFSDHGMPFPFAKTQLYHHSTRTPLMIRWPGVTKPNSIDKTHMVSAIDFVPTLLEVMKYEHPNPSILHGRSFAETIHGIKQDDRDYVILQYNENSGMSRHPMRGIHTQGYLYLFNPWSNGRRRFATATTSTATYRQMVKRSKDEPEIAARLNLFNNRVVEELFDIQKDPDCLVNLIDDPSQRIRLTHLRSSLAAELRRIDDPVAPLMAAPDDEDLRKEFMKKQEERTKKSRQARQRKAQR